MFLRKGDVVVGVATIRLYIYERVKRQTKLLVSFHPDQARVSVRSSLASTVAGLYNVHV